MSKLPAVILIVLIIVIVVLIFQENQQKKKSPTIILNREVGEVFRFEIENRIIGKLTDRRIDDYTPVMIYRRSSSGLSIPVGVGSLFLNSYGNKQIITADHLFGSLTGDHVFGYRILIPLETSVDYSISSVLRGANFAFEKTVGASPDVAILRVGDSRPISCSGDQTQPLVINHVEVSAFNEVVLLRSLVSGKEVRALGEVMINRSWYMIIEYDSVSGESGTGFVNDAGELFVLKGAMEVSPQHARSLEELFGKTGKLVLACGRFRSIP